MELDLICPSFAPLPESIWIAASAMIDVSTKACFLLLSAFVTIRMLSDALQEIEQVSVATHLRTIIRAIIMVVVLSNYKQLLMYFDYFIDTLCVYEWEGAGVALKRLQVAGQLEDHDPTKLSSLWKALKSLFSVFEKMIIFFTHKGAIYFMHYLRAVALLVLMQLGPIAMILSWLPGPFQKSFQIWLKNYVNISCWAITLQIFWALCSAFTAVSLLRKQGLIEGAIEPVGHILLSVVLLIAIFMTPTWTAKFTGSAMLSNFITSVGGWAGKASKAGSKMGVDYARKFFGMP